MGQVNSALQGELRETLGPPEHHLRDDPEAPRQPVLYGALRAAHADDGAENRDDEDNGSTPSRTGGESPGAPESSSRWTASNLGGTLIDWVLSRRFDCTVCGSTIMGHPAKFSGGSPCQHDSAMCANCMTRFLRMSIAGAETQPSCPLNDAPGQRCNAFSTEEDVLRFLGEDGLVRLRRWKLKQSNPDYRDCPTCDALQLGSADRPAMTCTECNGSFCFNHSMRHPPTESCADFELRLKKTNRQEQRSEAIVSRTTKNCPQCHAATHKEEGCNHMTCSRCRAHWCYRCGAPLDARDPTAHFSRSGGQCQGMLFREDNPHWLLRFYRLCLRSVMWLACALIVTISFLSFFLLELALLPLLLPAGLAAHYGWGVGARTMLRVMLVGFSALTGIIVSAAFVLVLSFSIYVPAAIVHMLQQWLARCTSNGNGIPAAVAAVGRVASTISSEPWLVSAEVLDRLHRLASIN